VAPTPGIAYWSAEVAVGAYPTTSTVFKATPFPGFAGLFGTASAGTTRADNVSSFRYASMNVGLYPTSNMMQYAGSITVWKCPIKMSTFLNSSGTAPSISYFNQPAIMGLAGVQAVGPDNYSDTFIKGVFSQSVCNEPEFEFSNILEGIQKIPPSGTGGEGGSEFALDAGENFGIVGWGNMDTIVMRVSSGADAVNTAVLKAWACIEYRPNPNATLYQYGHDSPALDEVALCEYRRIAKNLPCAVAAAENATMWERIKSILKSSLEFASNIPGPIGMTASGIRGITSLISGMSI